MKMLKNKNNVCYKFSVRQNNLFCCYTTCECTIKCNKKQYQSKFLLTRHSFDMFSFLNLNLF